MRDMATPKIAAWAVASPKYAIRRQTTKQPSGAAANATPIPASTALVMKSSSTVFYLLMGVIDDHDRGGADITPEFLQFLRQT